MGMLNGKINHSLSDIGFQLFPPSQELSSFVQAYWSIKMKQDEDKSFMYKIIADGGSGIAFNLGCDFKVKTVDGCYETIKEYAVTGPTDKTVFMNLSGDIHAYGIRFLPGGFNVFFPDHIRDANSLMSVFCDHYLERVTLLLNNIQSDISAQERVKFSDQFLLSLLRERKTEPDMWINDVVRVIQKHHGRLKNDVLAEKFSLSRRHFERRFKHETGLTVKQFSKIIRIQKARSLISLLGGNSLTEVGYECDYYDQSHFIREFKSLVRETPKNYQKRKKLMSRLYNS